MTTVLIVDDDEQLRRSVDRVLTSSGFECRTVGTVREALDAVATDGPDIVLLDVELGAESGLDVHRALRKKHARMPAVIFSTSRRDLFPTMLQQIGPLDDWIIKPWDAAEFLARVELASRRLVIDRGA
jgi:two-component system, OmpR family, response regulator